MHPDHQEFAEGARLIAIAVVSAALTATVVIGAGRALAPGETAVAAGTPALTTRVALR